MKSSTIKLAYMTTCRGVATFLFKTGLLLCSYRGPSNLNSLLIWHEKMIAMSSVRKASFLISQFSLMDESLICLTVYKF